MKSKELLLMRMSMIMAVSTVARLMQPLTRLTVSALLFGQMVQYIRDSTRITSLRVREGKFMQMATATMGSGRMESSLGKANTGSQEERYIRGCGRIISFMERVS